MDQVPRILAQRPWTLVIARDSKAQVRWNPVGRGDQHRGCAGRKTANTLLWLNVYQIQSQNLLVVLSASCLLHVTRVGYREPQRSGSGCEEAKVSNNA